MSYFAHDSAAQRYAAARPFFHPVVRELIQEHLGSILPLQRALDVACGTGQSTRILADLAHFVVGIDLSRGMLAQAEPSNNISYLLASAELLPFQDAGFDLITVALAFHWFDHARFLGEARRVLKPSGWLIIYNNAFMAEMTEKPAFHPWFMDRYLARYPSPPRNRLPFTDADAESCGFRVTGRSTYRNSVAFDQDQLVAYLMTQSNIIAAIEEGDESPADVRLWLQDELGQFFSAAPATFRFGGPITFLRRTH